MKIGYCQFAPVLGDTSASLDWLKRLMPDDDQIDLLVLPELCNSGYNFESSEQARSSAEVPGDSALVDFLQSWCVAHDAHVVTGFNELDGDRLFNSALLIGPEGLCGTYRKLHLFLNEKDHFQPGNAGLPVFEVRGVKVGMLICFDWQFPEAWRVLALKGADIICHPSNLVLPKHCQRALPTYALINRMFIITANRIGTEGDLTFTGRSTIASPNAEVLSEASADSEEVALVDVDIALARDKHITARNHVLNDRRPDQYALLCNPDSAN